MRLQRCIAIGSLSLAAICTTQSANAKEYTPEQLKQMVASGHPPPQGPPKSSSAQLEFEACKVLVQRMVTAAAAGRYPFKVGETAAAQSTKLWTNDGSVILTCTKPGVFITTVSKYK